MVEPLNIRVHCLGIGSDTTGADQSSALTSLEEVWREVEKLVKAGKVGGAGLCDLRNILHVN